MFIFSNLATSIDGKIATKSRALFPLGTPYDRRQMIVLRKKCDAILMGAATLRAWRKPCKAGNSKTQPINVVLSSKLEGISPEWDFFKDPDIMRIIFITGRLHKKKFEAFTKCCTVICLNKSTKRIPLAYQVIKALAQFKVKRLLVEGGGGVMWDFISHNLIDEINITLTPRVLGGTEAPTLVDGPGFESKQVVNFKLKKARKVANELYLTYRKTSHRGK
ncbi:MAG: dihydrofolate reductase family protein [Bdellovibrionota bacterium]